MDLGLGLGGVDGQEDTDTNLPLFPFEGLLFIRSFIARKK